jgi:acetyl-CoA carboxylase biotin carboxyl carrier protein
MSEHEQPQEEEPMSETGLAEAQGLVDPVAVGPGDTAQQAHADGAAGAAQPAAALTTADASLLALIDRLSGVLERGDLGELEVSSGGTTIILRSPSAIAPAVTVAASSPVPVVDAPSADASAQGGQPAAPAPAAATPSKPAVKAPLTGIYYGAPSPGAQPYVSVGDHVSVGQIIGLIEAMKLFNEIKSDLAGRVVRLCVDNGALVKATQPLIEVEPA